nr:hypothetical protein [Tanacetum cinerariifolium]
MESVKKSIDERAQHKRQYDRRVNKRMMQTQKRKVISTKALDVVVMESSGTKSGKQDTSSSLGNYLTHVVDADIKPINDQVPLVEVQLTAQHNVLANEQHHTEQSEPIYDTYLLEKVDSNITPDLTNMCHKRGEIDQDAELYQVKSPLLNAEFFKMKDMVKKKNSSKESYESNDMAHNHYLEESRKKDTRKIKNSKSTSLQINTNCSKQKPRSNNKTSRSLPVSKSSGVMSNNVPLVDHSRNSSSFSDSKHFVCLTCKNCVFNANHDVCLTKFLKEVNSRIKVQSSKTRNNIKPIEMITTVIKPKRWISKGYRISPNKSSVVHEKPNTPRSCLRWKLTGRIFKIAGLRWIPTGKMFTDSTTKVDSEPLNGSNDDITNPYECDQTLNVSACTLNLSAGLMQNIPSLRPTVPPIKNDWDSFFEPMFDEYFKPLPNVDHPDPEVSTPVAAASTSLPSSTTVDHNAPSTRGDEGDNEIDSFTKEPSDTLLMRDEVNSTTPAKENDELIKSSVDDLISIPRKSEVTSVCDDLECDMLVNTPLPTTDVREEDFDINSPLGEYVVDFLMDNVDVADLPRHFVKQLFNHLIKNPSLTKGMSDEPLGDDSKPISYNVTFSNPLFDFNDDSTLCYDNSLFDEVFEDISSLDLPESTPVIDESTLLVTLPSPYLVFLRDEKIDLLLRDDLDTLLTGDREIDFNPINFDLMPRSSETSDLFVELIAEFGLDDSIPTEIDYRIPSDREDLRACFQSSNRVITANVPKMYMQEFWATVSLHHNSLRFKMNGRSHTLNIENFKDMLQICPRLLGQRFKDPPFKEEILSFIRDLGHTGEIKVLTDVNVNYMHQP